MDLKKLAFNTLSSITNGQRVCAITTYKGRITALATNSYTKTHPKQKELATRVGKPHNEYLHAEIAALLKANKADTIHVFRLGKNMEFLNAKPCNICQLAINIRKIKRINHT